MNKTIYTTALLCLCFTQIFAKVLFVKEGATGNATSWGNANGDLASVLYLAEPGDEVWVARGTYWPTRHTDRTKAFTIGPGVAVYGGFSGTETHREERDAEQNPTILSGDIGTKNNSDDNSFTVVFLQKPDDGTTIDGFIVTDGTAGKFENEHSQSRAGGGLYVAGAQRRSAAPKIANCIFKNNFALDGGAVYIFAKTAHCSPVFVNCQFNSNKADLDGGAIFNDGSSQGYVSSAFENCTFTGNTGNYGGAFCNYGAGGKAAAIFKNCTFKNNEAYLKGGAIFNVKAGGQANSRMDACQFIGNVAKEGRNIFSFEDSGPTTQKEEAKMFKSN